MASLPTRILGRTGLEVTRLGYGAMELRGPEPWRGARDVSPEQAERILNAALDAGINFVDTSPDYGTSEGFIGTYISHRRSEYYLASKCGCYVGELAPGTTNRPAHLYTRENIVAGVEQSLRRMKTDHLDVVQLHGNPSRQVLEENDVVQTLLDLKRDGKVRFIGVSSTLPNLSDHIEMGAFDAFQIPYSALEQEHEEVITRAAQAGAGTIIRGGAARGAPVSGRQPSTQEIWRRAGIEDLLDGMPSMEFILRFTFTHPDVHTNIVGTVSPDHLQDNVNALLKGPLPEDIYRAAKARLAGAARV